MGEQLRLFFEQLAYMVMTFFPVILALFFAYLMQAEQNTQESQHTTMSAKDYIQTFIRTARIHEFPNIRTMDRLLEGIRTTRNEYFYPVNADPRGNILDMVPDTYQPDQVIGYCPPKRLFFTYSELFPPQVADKISAQIK